MPYRILNILEIPVNKKVFSNIFIILFLKKTDLREESAQGSIKDYFLECEEDPCYLRSIQKFLEECCCHKCQGQQQSPHTTPQYYQGSKHSPGFPRHERHHSSWRLWAPFATVMHKRLTSNLFVFLMVSLCFIKHKFKIGISKILILCLISWKS